MARLQDQFGRTIEYVRISVTDRCDLRCHYCLPKGFKGFSEPASWLRFEEIERLVSLFARLGVHRFRLTGGEPLLRRDLPSLVARLAAVPGVEDLSLTTNGTQLAQWALPLRQAGLHRLNVSLDSLQRDCVETITGHDRLPQILAGLNAAQAAGFERVKINMVPLQDINAHEIPTMIDFCKQHGFVLRLIEAMPLGSSGQNAKGLNLSELLIPWIAHYGLQPSCQTLGGGPARYWQSTDGHFSLGLITPLSQHFCATCNRLRLDVEGVLYPCLGQNGHYPLRPLLRAQADDETLIQALYTALAHKPERHEFVERPQQILRFMSMTGG